MEWYCNIPFITIMLTMFSAIIAFVLKPAAAKWLNICVVTADIVLSAALFSMLCIKKESFVYIMGHFPAPWGNEIRAGVLEAFLALLFSGIILLCVVGGLKNMHDDIEKGRQNLFFVFVSLLLSALLAITYTNDVFTAYVFVEINTIAACGLIMIRRTGRAITSAIQYMIMSQLGSGLFLIGLVLLYTITGHLLMPDIKEAVAEIVKDGRYDMPMKVIVGLITGGLCIKSGLYPFHLWIPEAYGNSTTASSALLSGVASKSYIILLIKFYYRILGLDTVYASHILNVVFVFGIIAIVLGSLHALWEDDIRRMVAYSSISHIGYIFMAMGLGTEAGFCAAIFHVFVHVITKPLIFISTAGLAEVSGMRVRRALIHVKNSDEPVVLNTGTENVTEISSEVVEDIKKLPEIKFRKTNADSNRFEDVKGAGYRNRTAGVGFTVGAMSMVGVPLLAGFSSKIIMSQAAFEASGKAVFALIALAVSTALMAVYFMRMVMQIYISSVKKGMRVRFWRDQKSYGFAILLFALVNAVFGLSFEPITGLIQLGLSMFG